VITHPALFLLLYHSLPIYFFQKKHLIAFFSQSAKIKYMKLDKFSSCTYFEIKEFQYEKNKEN